jgi:hypothetical protein
MIAAVSSMKFHVDAFAEPNVLHFFMHCAAFFQLPGGNLFLQLLLLLFLLLLFYFMDWCPKRFTLRK